MILMAELPEDLEARVAAEATRRALTTHELLRIVLDEMAEQMPGRHTMAALPFFISATPPDWEQTVRDWAARHNA
jgi:hypothetical protein